ncbi:HD domain-containing protein [soil metagenome]
MKESIEIVDRVIGKLRSIADKRSTDIYIIGGYVRDSLLGIESNDIDIMVMGDAIGFAEAAAKEFNISLKAVYKNFLTALLLIPKEDDVELDIKNISEYDLIEKKNILKIEFASSRKESYSENSRNPSVVPATLTEDLSRRDFTVNALAVKLTGNKNNSYEVIDHYEGLTDLRNKLIRTPLDPLKTFSDDPLRIMRGIRLAAKLGFSIEERTFEGMKEMAHRLLSDKVVSRERISNEFLQILMSDKPSMGLDLLYKAGVMKIIFPEFANLAGVEQRKDYHHKDVFYHTLQVVDNIAAKTNKLWLRYAALLHDIGKPPTKRFVEGTGWTFHGHEDYGARMLKKIFKEQKLPFTVLPYVEKLVRMHLRPIPLAKDAVTDSAIRRLAAEAGEELEDLLMLCRADITTKNHDKQSKYMKNYEIVEKKIMDVQEKDQLRNFQSPVKGEEIMEYFNLQPSRQVGIIKKKIEEAILEGLIPNEYEAAKKFMEGMSKEF